MLRILRNITLTLGIAFFALSMYAQENKELVERANDLFEEKEYTTALPMFSQLVSLDPDNGSYNYKFGACLMYVESDKNAPLKYLQFAAKQEGIDPEAYYYLGKGYHLNYRFDDAIKYYALFKENASTKKQEKFDVVREIEMCENGKSLIRNVTDIIVLQKKELEKKDFFRNYDVKKYGGKIIVKPEDFMSEHDKKIEDKSIMYLQQNSGVLYYSSYSEKGKTGKDIYSVRKKSNGDWGTPVRLGNSINTPYDEDYAFIHPNGKILYFCSKGHNSMGGFDVFKSSYNAASGTWGKAINMDYAINTPDDDYLFITDENEETAYFSSTRSSTDLKVTVYQIRMERVPINLSIIEGVFSSENTQSANITVRDVEKNLEVMRFKTQVATGKYTITLTSGRKYEFLVEMDGSSLVHQGMVELPKAEGIKKLKQEMEVQLLDEGKEKLMIRNLFDGDNVTDGELTAEMLKDRASLNVNADSQSPSRPSVEIIDDGSASVAANNSSKGETAGSLSNEEIAQKTKTLIDGLNTEAKEAEDKATVAFSVAKDKAEGAGGNEKLAIEASLAMAMALQLEGSAKQKRKGAIRASTFQGQIDEAVEAGNNASAQTKYDQLTAQIVDRKGGDSGKDPLEESYAELEQNLIESKEVAAVKLEEAQELQENVTETEGEITFLQEEIEGTKDKATKEELTFQKSEAEKSLEPSRKEAQAALLAVDQAQEQVDELEEQVTLAKSVAKEISSTDPGDVNRLTAAERSTLEANVTPFDMSAAATVASAEQILKGSDEGEASTGSMTKSTKVADAGVAVEESTTSTSEVEGGDGNNVVVSSEEGNTSGDKTGENSSSTEEGNTSGENAGTETEENSPSTEESGETNGEVADAVGETANPNESTAPTTEGGEGNETVATTEGDETAQTSEQTAGESGTDLPAGEKVEPGEENVQMALLGLKSDEPSKAGADPQENAATTETIESETVVEVNTGTEESGEMVSGSESTTEGSGTSSEEQATINASKEATEEPVAVTNNGATTSESSLEAIEEINATLTEGSASEDVLVEGDYNAHFTEKLAKADSETDLLVKEAAKGEILDNWAQNIEVEITELEQQAEATTSEEEKSELQTSIATLKETATAKRALSNQSYAKVAILTDEGDAEIAQNTAAEQGVSENGESTASTASESTTALEVTATLETPILLNATFEDQLKALDNAPIEPEEIEANKLEINKEWATAIDEQIALYETAVEKEADPTTKSQLERQLVQYRELAVTKSAEVATLEGKPAEEGVTAGALEETTEGTTVETGTNTSNSAPSLYDEAAFESNEAAILAMEAGPAREEAIAEHYSEWVEAIKTEETRLQEELQTAAGDERKTEIETSLLNLEQQRSSKETLMAEQGASEAAGEVAENVAGSEAATTEVGTGEAGKEESVAPTANALVPKELSGPERPAQIDASIAASEAAEEEAQAIEEQIVTVRNQMNTTKKKKDKRNLETRLTQLERDAEQKKVEAFRLRKRAEAFEMAGTTIMTKAADAPSESEKEFERATALRTEAAKYRTDATTLRSGANTIKKKKDKQATIDKAVAFEQEATYKEAQADESEAVAKELQELEETTLAQNFVIPEGGKVAVAPGGGTVTPEEAAAISASETYKKYAAMKADAAQAKTEAVPLLAAAEENKTKGRGQLDRAAELRTSAESLVDERQQQAYYEEAEKLSESAIQLISSGDSLNEAGKTRNDKAVFLDNESNKFLMELEEEERTGILAVERGAIAEATEAIAQTGSEEQPGGDQGGEQAGGNTESTGQSGGQESTGSTEEEQAGSTGEAGGEEIADIPTPTPVRKAPTTIPEVLTESVFEANASPGTSVYSEAQPIPVDKPQPTGLVFKVQIGAFSKPIAPDAFKGFSPIEGETTSSGYIRYTAGLFKSIAGADVAKQGIQDLGYPDAFVVAYLNGRRIPLGQAKTVAATGVVPAGIANIVGATPTQTTEDEGLVSVNDITSPGPTVVRKVQDIEGLFYTVQVGVYSKPVTSENIYNLSPLNEEKTTSGYYRYTSGIYNDLEIAKSAKERIQGLGVNDAFVTVYYQGKRWTIEDGQRLVIERGQSIYASTLTNQRVSGGSGATGVVYQVKMGEYGGDVPLAEASVILELSSQGVQFKKNDGKSTYFFGRFSDFNAASQSKNDLISRGLSQAVIVAFKDGNVISTEEAKRITNP